MIALIDEGHLDAGIVATLKKDKLKEYPYFMNPLWDMFLPTTPTQKQRFAY